MAASEKLIAQFEPQRIKSGDYEAQRQLDYRLVRGQGLRILSPLEQAAQRAMEHGEERDFQIAMRRRQEPAGATLTELARKYGL